MSVSCPEARVPPHQDSSVRTTGSTELTIRELKNITPAVQSDSKYIKRARKMALATMPQAEQIAYFLRHYARVAASPFPILSGDQ